MLAVCCKSALFPFLLYSALNYFAKFEIADRVRGHATRGAWGKIFDMRNDLRCDKATEIGVTRLATVRCPTGLAFDIERQTCDWKTNVKNCDQLESKRTPRLFP